MLEDWRLSEPHQLRRDAPGLTSSSTHNNEREWLNSLLTAKCLVHGGHTLSCSTEFTGNLLIQTGQTIIEYCCSC